MIIIYPVTRRQGLSKEKLVRWHDKLWHTSTINIY